MTDSLLTRLTTRLRDQFADDSTPGERSASEASVEPFAAPVPPEAVETAREAAVYDETADGAVSLVRLLDGLHRWTQRNRDAFGRWLTAAVAADRTLVTPVYVDDEIVTVVFPAERWRELKPTLNVTDRQLAAMVQTHSVLTVELSGTVVRDILAAADHEDATIAAMPDASQSDTSTEPTELSPATDDEESLEALLGDGPFA
ncbi:hypothetical protein BRC71_10170 [Halobacteriales archaeon QH_7_65_31]|nr:MAG: hypothetical protein BRC71_10170 [Halobacteriales archaeon QH_7_65_31]